MRELVATNDLVLISFIEALLTEQRIETQIFDGNISLMEGSIGVFPRRIMVADDNWPRASRILREAGLGEWLIEHERG